MAGTLGPKTVLDRSSHVGRTAQAWHSYWGIYGASVRPGTPKAVETWSDDEQAAWRDLWEDANLFVRVTRAGMMQVVLEGTLSPAARSQTYDLKLVKGQTYVFDLECTVFEPLLRLDDPAGKRVGEHEDVGPSPRTARLVITAPVDGVYRLVASSVSEAGIGPYSLRVAALKDVK